MSKRKFLVSYMLNGEIMVEAESRHQVEEEFLKSLNDEQLINGLIQKLKQIDHDSIEIRDIDEIELDE